VPYFQSSSSSAVFDDRKNELTRMALPRSGLGLRAHPEPSRANPHQRLGKLTLLHRIGAGSFGEVWKARNTELNRLVVVKIPHAGYLSDGKEDDRFLREARSAAVLRHPGIVPVHEVGHDEGLAYLACDFIEGLTLTDLLKTRRLTFPKTA
jgi:serine/threonine protein kinase